MNKTIRVFLFGGLGNQLFIFYAGQSLSRTLNKGVVYDLTEMNFGITKHGSSIDSLDFGSPVKVRNGRYEKLNHFYLLVLRRLARNTFLEKILAIVPGIYFSPSVGFDEDILIKKNLRFVYGYFQSWKHIDQFKESRIVAPPSVKAPTAWFTSKVIDAENCKPIMIHIRIGDYFKLSDTFGILGENYFRNAIIEARKNYQQSPLWVFSNDVDTAKKILKNIKGESFRYILAPAESNDAESMLLMSKGVAIVLSNSTFSWWSAAFSNPDTSVYYPNKWFKNLEDPIDLIPANWLPIQSDWLKLES